MYTYIYTHTYIYAYIIIYPTYAHCIKHSYPLGRSSFSYHSYNLLNAIYAY